jgi:ABC-type dipeptide/oligopeptide/nickel transport system permease component
MFYAMPVQWLALMLIILAAAFLPVGGMQNEFLINPDFFTHLQDLAAHMALPSLTFGLSLFGQYAVVTRSAMLETLAEDYVLTARAKGLDDRRVLTRHVLRNAMLPVSTLVALSFGYMVAGAILTETVFSWPGVGRAVYDAVLQRDYPMLEGAFLLLALSVVMANYVADLLYLRLDPRIAV